ncbi:CPBP family intramembrane glutamic endopeptidase [Haloprofundus sp. MHR1]|uniref:CPBP family intramembrane glutamic endopeptidase n=1 Tax=Haloprofundus sp. MHR1 TaxID=2572921 RepID=UPI0010BF53D0|nr:CPBP family intramembrane glutamic endopeptidase [Haloprofundus sp. MHR1]QCJ45856.1 CPBP family intramembrane metalloprotease [Haloprofundus sp. MHR1]
MGTASGSVTSAATAIVSGTALGVFGLGFGTLLAALVIVAVLSSGVAELSPTLVLVVGLVTTQGIGCFLTAVVYARYRHRIGALLARVVGQRSWLPTQQFAIPARIPSLRDLLLVVVAYVGVFGLVGAVGYAISAAGVEGATNNSVALGLENPVLLLWLIPGSILLIGPGEELLFRGVVQGRFRKRFGPVVAISLASVVFASVHYFALSGAASARFVTIGLLLVPAVTFGVVYELSENIVVPALVHGLYNATLFGFLYLSTLVS